MCIWLREVYEMLGECKGFWVVYVDYGGNDNIYTAVIYIMGVLCYAWNYVSWGMNDTTIMCITSIEGSKSMVKRVGIQ